MSLSTLESKLQRPVRKPALRTVRVALAGCGVVGGKLVRLLEHSQPHLATRYGVRFELVRVLVRDTARPRPAELPRGALTADLAEFLAADADLVVEAIGGIEPAGQIARSALAAGRRFVTANKALIAAHGPELMRRARRSGARLDFESAVAGGVPVLRAIRDQLPLTEIRSIRGILNGTTNFILTRMAAGVTYAEALREAQERGFAEADPARDVDGRDAADKLRILGWLVFGVPPRKLILRRRGIVPHPDRLAADAAALGGVPRLVAECVRSGQGVVASVEPTVVAPDSGLGRAVGEENLVIIESEWNGEVRLSGPGAGGGPTASALLGDMVRSARLLRPAPAGDLTAAPDATPHRWLISTARSPDGEKLLARTLARAQLEAASGQREKATLRALTAPAPWPRVQLAAEALARAGLDPVVLRVAGGVPG